MLHKLRKLVARRKTFQKSVALKVTLNYLICQMKMKKPSVQSVEFLMTICGFHVINVESGLTLNVQKSKLKDVFQSYFNVKNAVLSHNQCLVPYHPHL